MLAEYIHDLWRLRNKHLLSCTFLFLCCISIGRNSSYSELPQTCSVFTHADWLACYVVHTLHVLAMMVMVTMEASCLGGNSFRKDKISQPNISCHTSLCSIYNSLGLWLEKGKNLKWISWTATLVKVSGHKLKSYQTRVFVWFSTLIFPFHNILFMNRLQFSSFADFFCKDC